MKKHYWHIFHVPENGFSVQICCGKSIFNMSDMLAPKMDGILWGTYKDKNSPRKIFGLMVRQIVILSWTEGSSLSLLSCHGHHSKQDQIIFCEKQSYVHFWKLVNIFQLNLYYKVTHSSNCYIVSLDLARH